MEKAGTSGVSPSVENDDDDYDIIYVAMGEDADESKLNLIWAFDNFRAMKICILHIHVPPYEIPFRDAIFLKSVQKEDRLREHQENAKRKVQNVIKGYTLICEQARVAMKVLYAERDSIEIGIIEFIHAHSIRKLVMGEKKGVYICKHAPHFCRIWILYKGHLRYTRSSSGSVVRDSDASCPFHINSEIGSSAAAMGNNFEMKVSEGPGGYILEDVPHLSDYIHHLPTYPNPLRSNSAYSVVKQYFVDLDDTVPQKIIVHKDTPRGVHFRRAGPRQKVYFKSDEVSACIVTCGGLCPGLNTVIREIVHSLDYMYGVSKVLGIEGGYRGFYARNTIELTPKVVNHIHKRGGTILGSSQGGHDTMKIVDSIQDRGINQVFIIGGDGTQKGAASIYGEIRRRGLKVVIAGIPKTIDNDIPIIDRSFGFDTAVEEAQRAINAAHVEAETAENGLGVVKLMGCYCGFIAMYATLASRDVDCCLIPESPFYLEGKGGLFEYVEKRLKENGHMVIVIAEGAGQELLKKEIALADEKDASRNKLHKDVGLWISQKIKDHFSRQRKMTLNLKYIDPTYMIRAIPSNAADNVYCTLLAQSAVHGAMAGYTGFTSGLLHGRHTYIPFNRITEKQKNVVITDRMWARLLSSTNQPSFLSAKQLDEVENGENGEPPTELLDGSGDENLGTKGVAGIMMLQNNRTRL